MLIPAGEAVDVVELARRVHKNFWEIERLSISHGLVPQAPSLDAFVREQTFTDLLKDSFGRPFRPQAGQAAPRNPDQAARYDDRVLKLKTEYENGREARRPRARYRRGKSVRGGVDRDRALPAAQGPADRAKAQQQQPRSSPVRGSPKR